MVRDSSRKPNTFATAHNPSTLSYVLKKIEWAQQELECVKLSSCRNVVLRNQCFRGRKERSLTLNILKKSVVRTWSKDVVESGDMLDQSKRRSKGNMDVVTT